MGTKKWTWFGKPGHFIAADRCLFHLCTTVADGLYLVSTVGEYFPWSEAKGQREHERLRAAHYPGFDIGSGRKYETMVFNAVAACRISGCRCGLPETDGRPLDTAGYNTAGDAQEGHMLLCRKWDRR